MKKNLLIIIGVFLSFNFTAYFSLMYRFVGMVLIPFDIILLAIENVYYFFFKKKLEEPKLIFVVGIHRSGATFFAQSLGINSNYNNLSNFQLLFKRSTFFSNFFKVKIKSILFKNFYGQTFRLSDVGDLNDFWNYHLDLSDNEFINSKMLKINNSVKNYLKRYYFYNKKPIIIKSGRNLFISKKLYNHFSKSYFIFVRRDIKEINKSVKKARSVFLNYDWGLKVKNDKNFNKYDITKKNLMLEKIMINQIRSFKKERYSVINFKKFQKNQINEINKIKKKINEFFK